MRTSLLSAVLSLASLTAFAATEPRPLLRRPAVNRTHIVFSYSGDLWSVPRSGGEAVRLTAGAGVETDPYFSPDGTQIAFTGEYDGNMDVYVMPASGGVPRRVTFHPACFSSPIRAARRQLPHNRMAFIGSTVSPASIAAKIACACRPSRGVVIGLPPGATRERSTPALRQARLRLVRRRPHFRRLRTQRASVCFDALADF